MIKTTYAWFWIRNLALFIDMLIFCIISFVIWIIFWLLFSAMWLKDLTLINNLLWFIVSMLYFSLMHLFYGQTLWKMALWVKVVNTKLKSISIYQAFWRYFVAILSGLLLLLWFFWAWWDNKKRSFHDLLAKTLVITTRQTPSWVVIAWNIVVAVIWIVLVIIMAQVVMMITQNPDVVNSIRTIEWGI